MTQPVPDNFGDRSCAWESGLDDHLIVSATLGPGMAERYLVSEKHEVTMGHPLAKTNIASTAKPCHRPC
jgi:hypothetical protein